MVFKPVDKVCLESYTIDYANLVSGDLKAGVFRCLSFTTKTEVKKFKRPKSHADWNILFIYAIPAIAIFIAVLVFFIRFISSSRR
jgi:hypothetical protein